MSTAVQPRMTNNTIDDGIYSSPFFLSWRPVCFVVVGFWFHPPLERCVIFATSDLLCLRTSVLACHSSVAFLGNHRQNTHLYVHNSAPDYDTQHRLTTVRPFVIEIYQPFRSDSPLVGETPSRRMCNFCQIYNDVVCHFFAAMLSRQSQAFA